MEASHRGKIGRLPAELREQVNRRLEADQRGATLAAWLNGLPGVQAMLVDEFDDKPAREQNADGAPVSSPARSDTRSPTSQVWRPAFRFVDRITNSALPEKLWILFYTASLLG